jgi:uncharacterized protein with PQ loop repeat
VTAVGLFGTLGVVLSIVFAWPQALRARRAEDLSGVSAQTTLLLVFTATTWLLYGALVRDAAIVVANLVTVLAAALTLTTLLRRGRTDLAELLPLVGGWVLVLVVAAGGGVLTDGATPIGLFGAALGISMSVPQAWRVARGHGTEGVSLATYLLLLAVMATWLAYGLLLHDPVLWVPNLVGIAVVAGVVAVLLRGAAEPDVRVMLEAVEG